VCQPRETLVTAPPSGIIMGFAIKLSAAYFVAHGVLGLRQHRLGLRENHPDRPWREALRRRLSSKQKKSPDLLQCAFAGNSAKQPLTAAHYFRGDGGAKLGYLFSTLSETAAEP
jgi:hypothetical protein